jgi:hypothetical protein
MSRKALLHLAPEDRLQRPRRIPCILPGVFLRRTKRCEPAMVDGWAVAFEDATEFWLYSPDAQRTGLPCPYACTVSPVYSCVP